MRTRLLASAMIVAAATVALMITGHAQTTNAQLNVVMAQGGLTNPDADGDAIKKAAADFAEAFNKHDAKAIAMMWTENGESRESDGATAVGRAAIEKVYAEGFKAQPGVKIEVLVKSIRFPSKDLAIEEGLLRTSNGIKELPVCNRYTAIHIREAGKWLIALASESGPGEAHLESLDWLGGDWTTKGKDGSAVKLTFAKDPKKPIVTATFTKTNGKDTVTGSIRIQYDPETGGIRSWGFEDDGAHSQGFWHHDGKSWLIKTHGVRADGTTTAETIVLQRVAADAITWRSIDRILDGESLPDTPPMRLTKSK